MSTHRACCCEGQTDCYTSVRASVCQGGYAVRVFSLNSQIVQYQSTRENQFESSFGQRTEWRTRASGIAGIAIASVPPGFVGAAEYSLIRSYYGTDAFGPFQPGSARPITIGGQVVPGISAIPFVAETVIQEGITNGARIRVLPGSQAQAPDGEPANPDNPGWRIEHVLASESIRFNGECGTTTVPGFFGATRVVQAEASASSASWSVDYASNSGETMVDTYSATVSVVHRFADFLPGYSGPTNICRRQAGDNGLTNIGDPSIGGDPNAAAIDTALGADPMRRCKGCGQ